MVILHYAGERGGIRRHPYSVSALTGYYNLSLPCEHDGLVHPGSPGTTPGCARLSGSEPQWFSADSAEIATGAAQALVAATEAVRRGRIAPRCDGSVADCRTHLLASDRAIMQSADPCTPAAGRDRCYRIILREDLEVPVQSAAGRVADVALARKITIS